MSYICFSFFSFPLVKSLQNLRALRVCKLPCAGEKIFLSLPSSPWETPLLCIGKSFSNMHRFHLTIFKEHLRHQSPLYLYSKFKKKLVTRAGGVVQCLLPNNARKHRFNTINVRRKQNNPDIPSPV